MSELRGLGERSVEFGEAGVKLVAVSVESVAQNRKLAVDLNLNFPILSDSDLSLIRELGMVHEGAGPGGIDIARPGTFIVDRRERLAWMDTTDLLRHRPDPEEVLAEARKLVNR